jgi:hypothetical protein
MSDPKRDIPWISGDFMENRQKRFPPDSLLQYAGQFVAWSLDGTQLLGHGMDEEAVRQEMIAKGLNPDHAVWDQLPSLDEGGFLGAGAEIMDEDAASLMEE